MTDEVTSPSTVAEALAAAVALGVDRLDAQLLLLHALGRAPHDRAWLLAHDTDAMSDSAWASLAAQLSRRLAGEPVAYLLGTKEFHGLDLRVDARVLVPRPDTETLVDWALQCLEGQSAPRVLDLGTGSGAIALALQHARPDAQVDAVDASADALAVAEANARRLGLPVRFALAHWLDGAADGYAVIASNPPYIAANDPHLPALQHEPSSALVAGADGLDDIRQIVQNAPDHLAEGGWLLLEHGHDQAAAVRQLLETRGFAEVQSRDDLAGIQRCSGGIWRAVK
ncbi:peptide chain release factor N(5)-glutamine methyltransferase [Variovorax sp. ZS18.2.2]|uniref:peptide chain release factor N(5)-glutamine methyltransferase n=1 Tax=Variovorax sp. ZS18.2.2 TaxID=2971255 RepID=UPI002150A876|nr:peptide chain release factor N(5)-glutamine methyltransferase [Variovorax sp. ZS18.2.2]MCR6477710.1 peptide chain release factor N(5)-glutamine methyltransferase [Variovorax sp. ZS18.2.2]